MFSISLMLPSVNITQVFMTLTFPSAKGKLERITNSILTQSNTEKWNLHVVLLTEFQTSKVFSITEDHFFLFDC